MSTVLMSIKPEYVSNILNGKKKYEFRKNACKKEIEKMIIYSTSPISKVVGEARIEKVYIDTPTRIWQLTSKYAGINREAYEHYYEGRNSAVAYKLSDVIRYEVPRKLEEYGIKSAPQSYYYIEK